MIPIYIGNVTNAYSTRPTQNFNNMAFYDFEYQNLISSYTGQLFSTQTYIVSNISNNKISIT